MALAPFHLLLSIARRARLGQVAARGPLATMEPGAASQEEKDFTNVATTRFTAPGHGGSVTVARLGLRAGYSTGPSKTLAVQRGDTVTITAYAWLTGALAASAQAPTAQAARVVPYVGLDTPLNSPAVVAPPGGQEHARTGGFNPFARLRLGGAFALGARRTAQNAAAAVVQPDGLNQIHDGTAGNAQLHYIVRDASGTTVLDDYQSANPGTAGTWQQLQVGLRLEQGGTVELRVETEGALGPDVYFDDVRVDHTASTIVQEQHSYAFGSPLVGLNYAVGNKRYRHGYQGQYAEKDAETGFESFELRMYNSRIGRWTSYDPEGEFDSPYVGMGNNPVSQTDPDGGMTCCGGGKPNVFGGTRLAASRAVASSTTKVAANASARTLGTSLTASVLRTGAAIHLPPRDKVGPAEELSFTRKWANGNWFNLVVNYDAVNTLYLAPQLVAPGDSRRNYDGTFASQRSAASAFYSTLAIVTDFMEVFPIKELRAPNGGNINGFSWSKGPGWGAKPRLDVHPLVRTSKKSNTFPNWVQDRTLPHYHRGKGNNLRRHRPWETGWDDKSFLDRW